MPHVVGWMLLAVVAVGCASAPAAPVGTLVGSPASPIPLRAGHWLSPELQDVRLTREGLGDVTLELRWSGQFPSREATLPSPLVDVVVARPSAP